MRVLLVSPKSGVWNSRMHIHMGLGYLAGALIAAGYDDVTIFDAEVEEETLSCLEAAKKHGGIIAGISNYIMPRTPEENIWAMIHSIKKHK